VSQPYDPTQPVPGTRDEAPRDPSPGPVFALGPDGQPFPTEVPADFAAQQAAALAAQLTPEEIAEFRALRDAQKLRDQQAADEAAAAAARLQPATHFVHLADGSVTEGSPIETHVDTGHGIYPVTGAFPKPEFVTFPA
jgi:hypothetical protein